jgi:catechol 2,3-dioxygenase-like lactoylglutathione lyase family enzyme/ketosteroid isomerase-like protein
MTLDRLDHLVLTVRDPGATCDFYRRVLGMEPVTFAAGRLAMRFGSQKINLHPTGREFEPKAERPTPGSSDLCFLTDEPLEKWIARLVENGVPLLEGPVKRTGALGPIESIYLRDPDGNLLEIGRQLATAEEGLAELRDWLRRWQACVRARDFEGGRRLCAPELIAFGTVADFVESVDRVIEAQWRRVWPNIRDFTIHIEKARGAVRGDTAWVAASWHSEGVRPDGTTFPRPGRLTIAFARRAGRWLAVHTHFSLTPSDPTVNP